MTNYDYLLKLMQDSGMDRKWAKMFVKKLADDEAAFPVDDRTKEWMLSKGFYPGRSVLYNFAEENYQDYLPDYHYFMIHPINHHFKIWVNDKLTLKYVLNSNDCEDTVPAYYLYIENNGHYTYLMDTPAHIARDENFIISLLKEKGTLAMKPNSGTSGGRGFMKMEYRNGNIYENNKQITEEDFKNVLPQLRNYVVTEYVYQHPDLAKIWSESECTLRIIMVKLPQDNSYSTAKWHCIVSFARFGSAVSGGASNLSSGGIGIGFDFQTGKFRDFGVRYKRFCTGEDWKCTQHPDSQVVWKDTGLPNWPLVKDKLEHICNHISSLDYLGFDVIITPNGMKLCEINTHPAADYAQVMCAPILADAKAKAFFESKGLFEIDPTNFYDMYQKSQF